jgi:hypothetical protein
VLKQYKVVTAGALTVFQPSITELREEGRGEVGELRLGYGVGQELVEPVGLLGAALLRRADSVPVPLDQISKNDITARRDDALALVQLSFSLSSPSRGVALGNEALGLLGIAPASNLCVVSAVAKPDRSHVYTSVVPQVCQGWV